MKGTTYLIHFDEPYQHARHYIGWAKHLDARINHHRAGTGARLMAVVTTAGIPWTVARTWENTDRTFERRLKKQHNAARLCPICHLEQSPRGDLA